MRNVSGSGQLSLSLTTEGKAISAEGLVKKDAPGAPATATFTLPPAIEPPRIDVTFVDGRVSLTSADSANVTTFAGGVKPSQTINVYVFLDGTKFAAAPGGAMGAATARLNTIIDRLLRDIKVTGVNIVGYTYTNDGSVPAAADAYAVVTPRPSG